MSRPAARMLMLYNAALLPLRIVGIVWGALRSRRPDEAREWRERLARQPPSVPPDGWWIHGASVGEARIVRRIAAEVRSERPETTLCVSAVTKSGVDALPAPPDVDATMFAPLDFSGLPRRILEAVRPRVLVLVETELWPNLVREARSAGIRIAVVNARLSPERMRRYRRFGGLFRTVLGDITRIGAQSDADARRFEALGAAPDRIEVTGNIKYDLEPPTIDRAALRARLGLDGSTRVVVVAGSTGEGEEPVVLDAFASVSASTPEALLFLAPRYPARCRAVLELIGERGLRAVRLSEHVGGESIAGDVVVVDTIGELAALYGIADATFVGGSLVPIGGHNVLEPVRAGAPVSFGPFTDHVREPAVALVDAGAADRVVDAASLAAAWNRAITDPARRERMTRAGRAVLAENLGALEKTMGLLRSLDPSGGRR